MPRRQASSRHPRPATGCRPQGSISRNGSIVSLRLNFVRAHFTINNPDPADPAAGRRGSSRAPLLRRVQVRSGDLRQARRHAARGSGQPHTDVNDPSCLDNPPAGLALPPLVGCFNTINMHTHGLHVSPAGNSDNVLLNIAPQTEFPYEYNLPADHPAGTFWYHAHRHGSTAVQVASGASGVLIVEGNRPYAPPTPLDPHPIADIDTVLHDAGGKPLVEQLFLLQQIAYACFQNLPGQVRRTVAADLHVHRPLQYQPDQPQPERALDLPAGEPGPAGLTGRRGELFPCSSTPRRSGTRTAASPASTAWCSRPSPCRPARFNAGASCTRGSTTPSTCSSFAPARSCPPTRRTRSASSPPRL